MPVCGRGVISSLRYHFKGELPREVVLLMGLAWLDPKVQTAVGQFDGLQLGGIQHQPTSHRFEVLGETVLLGESIPFPQPGLKDCRFSDGFCPFFGRFGSNFGSSG